MPLTYLNTPKVFYKALHDLAPAYNSDLML